MSDARRHAITASELLNGLDRVTDHVREMSPAERLQLVAQGAIKSINADMAYTIQLANAHANAALALAATDDDLDAELINDEGSGDDA